MKVVIIFEFEGVDADSEKANKIIDGLSESCETMKTEFGADSCFIDDAYNP